MHGNCMFKSTLYVAAGLCLIILFAGQLLMQLLFLLIGFYLIYQGLALQGIQTTSHLMRFWMKKF